MSVTVGVVAAIVVGTLVLHKSPTPKPLTRPNVSIAGIPQTGRVLGDPNAKVTLIEFADPQCPACRFYTLEVYPTIVRQYVRTGEVKTEFHGFPFIGPDSMRALRFILAASFQNKLWQLEEALYRYQGRENSGWVTDVLVRRLARQIPGLDVKRLFEDEQSAKVTSMIASDNARVKAYGLNSTPSILVEVGGRKPSLIQNPTDLALMRATLADALKS
jgi:protein-disulfide isomerase